MAYTCHACGGAVLRRRNGRLECARCGAPAGGYLPEDELLFEQKARRGRAFLLARRWTEAEALYRELRDLRPEDPEGYLGLAAALSRSYSLPQPAVPDTLVAARRLLPAGRVLPPAACRYLEKELALKRAGAHRADLICTLWGLACLSLFLLVLIWAFGGRPGRAVLSAVVLIVSLRAYWASRGRREAARAALNGLEEDLK